MVGLESLHLPGVNYVINRVRDTQAETGHKEPNMVTAAASRAVKGLARAPGPSEPFTSSTEALLCLLISWSFDGSRAHLSWQEISALQT